MSHGEQVRQVRRVRQTTPYLPRRTRREIARGMLRRRREIARSVWRHKHTISDYTSLLILLPIVAILIGLTGWQVLTWLFAVATGHAHL